MLSFSQFFEQHLDPLYVAVSPDENTKRLIKHIQATHNLPNPYDPAKTHCTLIYSNKPCAWPKSLNPARVYQGSFHKWDIFNQRNGKKCLVMKIDSQALSLRHKDLMSEMGASYDFPEYLPHITLSYDIDDFDVSTLPTNMFGEMFFSDEKCVVLDAVYTS